LTNTAYVLKLWTELLSIGGKQLLW